MTAVAFEENYTMGWHCFDCEEEEFGYISWISAQSAADDHMCAEPMGLFL